MNDRHLRDKLDAITDAVEAMRDEIAITSDGTDAEVRALAARFCRLNDDAQARFFVEAARLMDGWGPAKASMQAHYIGRHLKECACSTSDARNLIESIAEAIKP